MCCNKRRAQFLEGQIPECSNESVGLTLFLMSIERPSPSVVAAVEGAMAADTFEVTVPEVNLEEGDLDLQIPADMLEAPEAPEAPATTTPAPQPAPAL